MPEAEVLEPGQREVRAKMTVVTRTKVTNDDRISETVVHMATANADAVHVGSYGFT